MIPTEDSRTIIVPPPNFLQIDLRAGTVAIRGLLISNNSNGPVSVYVGTQSPTGTPSYQVPSNSIMAMPIQAANYLCATFSGTAGSVYLHWQDQTVVAYATSISPSNSNIFIPNMKSAWVTFTAPLSGTITGWNMAMGLSAATSITLFVFDMATQTLVGSYTQATPANGFAVPLSIPFGALGGAIFFRYTNASGSALGWSGLSLGGVSNNGYDAVTGPISPLIVGTNVNGFSKLYIVNNSTLGTANNFASASLPCVVAIWKLATFNANNPSPDLLSSALPLGYPCSGGPATDQLDLRATFTSKGAYTGASVMAVQYPETIPTSLSLQYAA